MGIKLVELPLESITIGERFREDLGEIEDLMASIQEKGILQPVTVDQNLNLLAGGRRCEAARRLGLKTIPALIRQTADELDAREVELLENAMRKDMTWQERCRLVRRIVLLHREKTGTSYGEQSAVARILDKTRMWVSRQVRLAEALELMPELADEKTEADAWRRLEGLGRDVQAAEARQAVLDELAARKHDDDEPSEPSEPSVDWLQTAVDNYRIADTLEALPELPSNLFHLIEVDPPYAIDLVKVRQGRDAAALSHYEELDSDSYLQMLKTVAAEAWRCAAPDAWCLWWFGPTWFAETKAALTAAGWTVDDIPGVWAKPTGQSNQPSVYLGRAYEPFFICRKGKARLQRPGRPNVFSYNQAPPTERFHATQKPLDLMLDLLETFAWPGQRVLVPFLGSGVTLRACYRLGLLGLGFDLSERNRDHFLQTIKSDIEGGCLK